jgi:hypothetical protein
MMRWMAGLPEPLGRPPRSPFSRDARALAGELTLPAARAVLDVKVLRRLALGFWLLAFGLLTRLPRFLPSEHRRKARRTYAAIPLLHRGMPQQKVRAVRRVWIEPKNAFPWNRNEYVFHHSISLMPLAFCKFRRLIRA